MSLLSLNSLYLKIDHNVPFEYIAASGYLIGNLSLILKGVIVDGNYIFPAFHDISRFDTIALQPLSGLLVILVSLVIYSTKKYPKVGVRSAAFLYYLAYGTLLLSGYKQDAFIIHALGILPCLVAATLMLKGNTLNSTPKNILDKYPIASAGFLFASGLPAIMYSAVIDQDYTLIFACCVWILANIAFAMTDKNLKKSVVVSQS